MVEALRLQLAGNCPQAAIVVEHDLHQRSFLKA
jgi:hypothetical protein